MRAPSTQPYRAMGGTRSGTGKTGTGKKWAVNTAEDRAARKTLKGGRCMHLLCCVFPGFLLLSSVAALASHHARAAVLCSRTHSLSGDPGWLPAVFVWLDLCFGLDQAGSAEVSPSAILLAEGPPDNAYLSSMFSLLRSVSTFRLGSVRSVETLRSPLVDSHLGILHSDSLTVVNTAL